jgi:magnesium transporter
MTQLPTSLSSLTALVRRLSAPGTAPGTLPVHEDAHGATIRVMAYSPEQFLEREIEQPEEVRALLTEWPVTWIDVDGFGDTAKLAALAKIVELHPLAMEDAVTNYERPKVEHYTEHEFVVLRMLSLAERIQTEQLSLFVGPGFVVTLQGAHPGDSLDPVRDRIRASRGRIRSLGADYLAYALIDAVIDHYFPVVEAFGDRLEQLEGEVVTSLDQSAPARIHAARHDLLTVRRSVAPLKDAIASLYRDESPFVSNETRLYLRDCHDHAIQIVEVAEAYREIAGSLLEIHLSAANNRMNEVMKVLTVIATLFIPLTFIAGIYGMNFDRTSSPLNMPELGWYFGYPFALGLMAATTLGLLLYFRHRGWLR